MLNCGRPYSAAFVAPMRGASVLAHREKTGKWGPFGGKVEERDGGDAIQTALREFCEEWKDATGLDAAEGVKALLSSAETFPLPPCHAVVYKIDAPDWLVEAEQQHDELQWVCSVDTEHRYPLQRICEHLSFPTADRGTKRTAEGDPVPRADVVPRQRNFTERISMDHARYFLSLTNTEIKAMFWDIHDDRTEDGKKRNCEEHTKMVRKYAEHALKNGGIMDVLYNYARTMQATSHQGRRFANRMSLQSMQGKIRAFLCACMVQDLDMINAHLVLFLDFVRTHLADAERKLLEAYVLDREAVLRDNSLKKRDVLVALNCDAMATTARGSGDGAFYHKGNKWIEAFWAEKDKAVPRPARQAVHDGGVGLLRDQREQRVLVLAQQGAVHARGPVLGHCGELVPRVGALAHLRWVPYRRQR
jgi:hypothetical protein